MDTPSVLGACRKAIAIHLSSIFARPWESLLPLVQQTTTHRKPSHSVFSVVIRRLGKGVNKQTLEQCLVLPPDLQQVIERARRTQDILLFDPVPLHLIQRCLERIYHDFSEHTVSSESQGRVQSDSKGKRDRDASESTVLVNGARLQADENPYTWLRRVVLTGFTARLIMRESHGDSVKVIMEPSQPGADADLGSELMRGLNLYTGTSTGQAIEANDPYLETIKGALESGHDNGIQARLKDGAWVVDLHRHKLGYVKVFTATPSAGPPETPTTITANAAAATATDTQTETTATATASMDVPTPTVETLVSLARLFSETECTRYVWVVPEARQLFVEQVLFLAKIIFPDIHVGHQRSKRTTSSLERASDTDTGSTPRSTAAAEMESWTRAIDVVYFGQAFETDTLKASESEGEGSGASIIKAAKFRMREIVVENRGQPQTTMASDENDDDDDSHEDGGSGQGHEHGPLDEAELSRMAAMLSLSALTVASAGGRRLRRLNVDMNRILDGKGNSGVFLQYVLSRLHGIERKSKTRLNPEADLTVLLPYDEALNLALVIAEWYDVVPKLHEQQDPHLLVSYLFNLAAEIGHANRVLRVKDMASSVAEARWLLFWAAKSILEQGLELLGLQSVEQM
ncbi:Arginyl-tRNA synthetase [Mortierella alpina]|nr:Arginyl-tRNA synthetase [Mortierella alpina]